MSNTVVVERFSSIVPSPLVGYKRGAGRRTLFDLESGRYSDLAQSANRLANIAPNSFAVAASTVDGRIIFTGVRTLPSTIGSFSDSSAYLTEVARMLGIADPSDSNEIKVAKPRRLDGFKIEHLRHKPTGKRTLAREVTRYLDDLLGLNRKAWLQVTLGNDGYSFIGASWTMDGPNRFYADGLDFVRKVAKKLTI